MNKQYNVDDILLEIKAKKSKQGPQTSNPVTFPVSKKPAASAPVIPEKTEAPVTDSNSFNFRNTPSPAKTEQARSQNMDALLADLKLDQEKEDKATASADGFNFKLDLSAPKEKAEEKLVFAEEAAPKKKENFKITIPDEEPKTEEKAMDYNRYFTSVKEEDADSFRFQTAPLEATRVVNLDDEKKAAAPAETNDKKAPFKLNFNFDGDSVSEPTTAIDPPSPKPKGLFPEEMLDEEPKKKGLFGRKKAKIQDMDEDAVPISYSDEEDEGDLDDYSSSEDKGSVIRDMRMIKTGLIIRVLLMIVVFGISTYLALSATNPLLSLPSMLHPESQLRNFMIANTVVAAVGALICSNTVGGGLLALLKLKADSDTLPAMAVVATLVQGVCFIVKPDLFNMTVTTLSDSEYTITTAVSLFFPVAMLILLFNLIGKIMTVLRIQNNFKLVASDRSKYSINMMENKGLLKEWTKNLEMEDYLVAYPVKTRFLSKFLEYSYSEDYAESMSAILAPVSILAGILISVLSYVFNQDLAIAISTFAAVLCICTPLSSTIAANWPMLRLSNKLTPNGAMVAGYESISKFADTEGIVMKASDIFPPENVTLHAIKAFDQSKIDSVILDAASVVCSTKGMLTGVFTKIIGSDKSLLRPVEHVTYEDAMGLSAWVDGKRVLIGNRELMVNHGVEVPSLDYEKRYVKDSKNIVYLSNSGELSAMFVISYNANSTVMEELETLEDYGMFLIVETSDPNITAEKIHEAYGFPLEQLQLMPAKTNSQYRSMTEEQTQAPARIGYIGGARTMIRAIIDCIKVKSSISQSVVIQMASLIIGYGIIAVFSLVGDLGMLNFVHLILYQLFWTLLVIIFPNLKKL